MVSFKISNFKGLNNDISDQQSRGYFPVASTEKHLAEGVLQKCS